MNIVCANAGIGSSGTIDSLSSDHFREIFDVNFFGVLNTIQAFLPALRRARAAGGISAVLVTGSEHSLGVPPYVPPMTAYTASKHALLGLAAAARRDLADDGISVAILCPSYVRTERLRELTASVPALAETLERYGQDAEDVARRAFDGVERGTFVIPTNTVSYEFVVGSHHEVIEAMKQI